MYCSSNEESFLHLKNIHSGTILGEAELFRPHISRFSCKSKGYSTIAYLSHKDLMNAIKGFKQDFEKIMMQRDLIDQNINFKIFSYYCEICNGAHNVLQCPFVFE